MIDAARRLPRGRLVALGIALFVSYAYFYEAGGWNQNSRFDLVRAVVGDHTFKIDAYAFNTGDQSTYNGHTYSDKAPGVALSAIPFVAVARPIVRAAGIDPVSPRGLVVLSYVATVAVEAVPTALGAVCLAMLATRLFGSAGAGTFVAVVFGLGTPAWAYATLFQGHALATACLFAAYAAAIALPAAATDRARVRLAFAVGLLSGWATVTEMTCAIPAVIIASLALWRLRRFDPARVRGAVVALTIGALVCVAVLITYNDVVFGAPLHIGYASEAGFDQLKTGFFGITAPKLPIAGALLFGWFRGLLPLSPVLAAVPLGWWWWRRRRADGDALIVAMLIPIYYLGVNSGYFYWEGGWSYGPRHMAPALPFLALAIAPLFAAASRSVRWGLTALAIVSVGLTIVGVSVTPQPPIVYDRPLAELWWPAFNDGDLSVNNTSFDMKGWNPEQVRHHPEAHEAWNLGERAGLTGRASLVPLLFVWAMAAGWWMPETMRRRA